MSSVESLATGSSRPGGESGEQLFGGRLGGALDFDRFVELCADPMGSTTAPSAEGIERGVPVYDGDRLRAAANSAEAGDPGDADYLCAELAEVFGNGSGVIAVKAAWPDRAVLDSMTELLLAIVERERSEHDNFDHFAAAGANSRAWDVFGKAAKADPTTFVAYYGNDVLDLVSTAWLGPWYQVTAQVNIVHPGGAAQAPHRDYHLGFLSDEDAARFPMHVHRLSPALTLQGAAAHTAMPIESGPTMLLPGSQRFVAGYLAWRDDRFRQHFAEHHVQLELEPGDAVFFNPALFHGAGENRTTDFDRIANLFQVSSAFGIAMEAIDSAAIAVATYPHLVELAARGELRRAHLANCASGYAFPSNLDTDTSDAGLAPASLQAVMRTAITEGWPPDRFAATVASKQAARAAF